MDLAVLPMTRAPDPAGPAPQWPAARRGAATAASAAHARGAAAQDGAPGRAPGVARLAELALLALVYLIAGKLGLMLAAVHPSATAIWPCTGIALAALLIRGQGLWPAVFLGAFLVNATTTGSALTVLGIATGNTLEAVVGAALVRRFAGGREAFLRAADTFRYTGLVALACAVSASIGVASLSLTGFAPWRDDVAIWLTWWLGDMGGALLVAPFLLLWSRDWRIPWDRGRALEAAALLACLIVLAQVAFGWLRPITLGFSVKFLCVPPLLWAAFRFDPRLAATGVLALAAVAVSGTMGRIEPTERWVQNQALLVLQVFLGVTAVTTLALSALVAERRRAMEALRATSERLRDAMARLESFTHAISHDLRSPLGTVVNHTDLVEEDYGPRMDDEGLRRLGRIRAAAESATGLLDQLSLFASTVPPRDARACVDMTALAREAFAEVVTGDGEPGDVLFELHDLPPATGDPRLLGRVFRNLLGNSVKYTRGRAHRRIEVSAVIGAEENTYSVSDNGIGFDDSEGAALFEPYRRLSGARGFEGSGLGLAVAARIVHGHGGRIWAQSDGASGARFAFTLPRKEEG